MCQLKRISSIKHNFQIDKTVFNYAVFDKELDYATIDIENNLSSIEEVKKAINLYLNEDRYIVVILELNSDGNYYSWE